MTSARGLPISIAIHAAIIAALLFPFRHRIKEVVDTGLGRPVRVISPHGPSKPGGRSTETPPRVSEPPKRHFNLVRRPPTETPPPAKEEVAQLGPIEIRQDAPLEPGLSTSGMDTGPQGSTGDDGMGTGVVRGNGLNAVGPLPFDETMTPPHQISGPDPSYTPQAIEHEVEGTMLVRCIVGLDGSVRSCRVVRGLPFMDREVVGALERRRYSPALVAGHPAEVDYTFKLELRLP
jgi:protein TonB